MTTPGAVVPRLRLAGITKTYANVAANDAIDLEVAPGEIHAVLGENGAGKSTLMRIVYGITRPDAGTLAWDGVPTVIASPAVARALGIAMVFQHFSLFETLTVAENIALTQDGRRNPASLGTRIRDVSERYGLALDPGRHVHTMSVGERQRVEIVRALLQAPKLLIMDEPTSVLTPQAVARLFATLRRLAAEGCSILYVSHKLDEIRDLCDRATVLRAGKVAGECDPHREPPEALARMMIGGDLPRARHRKSRERGAPRLVVNGLSLAPDDPYGTALVDVRFAVHGGEILGIAGISGNGQRELAAALSGERTADPEGAEDTIVVEGVSAGRLGVRERRALGLVYVPEERFPRGAVPEMSLAENTLLTANARAFTRAGFVRARSLADFTTVTIREYNVKGATAGTSARALSGGNLQKFIVGREVRQAPTVLIAAQPTWGLDVAATAQIRQALIDLRDDGAAVLVISDDLDELVEICDSIAVMTRGRLSPILPASAANAQEIGLLIGGSAGVSPGNVIAAPSTGAPA